MSRARYYKNTFLIVPGASTSANWTISGPRFSLLQLMHVTEVIIAQGLPTCKYKSRPRPVIPFFFYITPDLDKIKKWSKPHWCRNPFESICVTQKIKIFLYFCLKTLRTKKPKMNKISSNRNCHQSSLSPSPSRRSCDFSSNEDCSNKGVSNENSRNRPYSTKPSVA